jgi:hypothetical protein
MPYSNITISTNTGLAYKPGDYVQASANDSLPAYQNIAGSNSTTGFFLYGFQDGNFGIIQPGWYVTGYPSIFVESVDIPNSTITITGGVFISGDSYGFTINGANNYIIGTVVSYNSGTGSMVLTPIQSVGSGTYSSWIVSLTGAPGSSGTSATSGTAGVSGSTGTNGTSGGTGSSGVGGESNISGSNGNAGANGSSGTSGIAGTTGTSGVSGSTGTSGISGSSGAVGASSGTSATSGTSGVSTVSGTSGSSGVPGASALSALSSTSGSSGTSGGSGLSGGTGPTGPIGPQGLLGPQGFVGSPGANGTSGATGFNGATGPQGGAGAQGPAGGPGAQGPTGSAGTSGVNGGQGPVGAQGSRGPTGPPGPTGPQGNRGPTGPQGGPGPTGAQGPAGGPGPAGSWNNQTLNIGSPATFSGMVVNNEWYTNNRFFCNNGRGMSDFVGGVFYGNGPGWYTFGTLGSTNFFSTSSRDYKTNIQPFTSSAIDIIDNTEIVTFYYEFEGMEDKLRIGFIAENTPEELATKSHDRIDINSSIGVMMKAVQELDAKLKIKEALYA